MTIEEFLQDRGSTTGYFSGLSQLYKLEILHHGINGAEFERIVAIYLENIPVMLGVSNTKLSHKKFLDILQNAAHIPIGTKLFAPDAGIVRTNMRISQIFRNNISNQIINSFLLSNIPDIGNTLYFRQSDFIYKEQSMQLDEYVLPGLIKLLAEVKE